MSAARGSPPSAVGQLIAYLHPATLRELAAVKERQDPARLARRQLTPVGVERLAEILLAGTMPTVGFWLRHRQTGPAAPPDDDADVDVTDESEAAVATVLHSFPDAVVEEEVFG